MFVEKMAKFFDINILKEGTVIFYKNKADKFEGEAIITYAYDTMLYVKEIGSPFEYDDMISIDEVLSGNVELRIIQSTTPTLKG